MTPVRLEPTASRSRVKHSTPKPLPSLSIMLGPNESQFIEGYIEKEINAFFFFSFFLC